MRMVHVIGFVLTVLTACALTTVLVYEVGCPAPAVEKPPLPAGPRQPTTGGERF